MFMSRKKYLIFMAAGSGSRMGADLPKQFIEVSGKAILHITMERFIEHVPDIKIITVLPPAYIDYWKNYCYTHNFNYTQVLVKGGITRFHSVKNALEKIPEDVLVAVHDGVRPFVSKQLILDLFKHAESAPGVVPIVPCVDTMKVLENDGTGNLVNMGEKVERSKLFAVQTPQVFKSEILKEAYLQPYAIDFTDDASVVENKKINLSYVLGERFNIKLTSPDDLTLAKALASMGF